MVKESKYFKKYIVRHNIRYQYLYESVNKRRAKKYAEKWKAFNIPAGKPKKLSVRVIEGKVGNKPIWGVYYALYNEQNKK